MDCSKYIKLSNHSFLINPDHTLTQLPERKTEILEGKLTLTKPPLPQSSSPHHSSSQSYHSSTSVPLLHFLTISCITNPLPHYPHHFSTSSVRKWRSCGILSPPLLHFPTIPPLSHHPHHPSTSPPLLHFLTIPPLPHHSHHPSTSPQSLHFLTIPTTLPFLIEMLY